MAVGFSVSLALLTYLWTSTASHQLPEGALQMECRDRYFMIAVNLSFTGEDPHFEATDGMGVYPITKTYASQNGYSVNAFPARGLVELRASYFSTHTYNKKDEVFVFSFNMVVSSRGELKTHRLNQTCALALPWVQKEITCESNYMEVSVIREVTCPAEMQRESWAAFRLNYPLLTEDVVIALHTRDAQLKHLNLSEAFRQGYVFQVTTERLVFRTAYGQPDSIATEVNGVPVEVVRATVYSKHGWVMFMMDLVATCSMHEGAYESGHLRWETPEDVDPISAVDDALVAVGLNGDLLHGSLAQQRGFVVTLNNSIFQISVPYKTEGAQRKSLALDGLYEFYVFNLYVEQIFLEGDQVDARLRIFRTLAAPLLPRPLFTLNGTSLGERTFLAYLGDVPEDVALVSVALNEQEFLLQAQTLPGFSVTEVAHANATRGYTLKVPFDHPAVRQQFSKQDRAMQYVLTVQFTLHVLPEESPVHLQTSMTALVDASPPAVNASCSDSGIRFTLEHRPSNPPWQITVGSDLLTSQLAARHGYVLSNDGQWLQLDVPLFTTGYEYNNLTLKGFTGTFTLHLQDPRSAEVYSRAETCSFSLSQYISCSSNGVMTVVADLSPMVQSGVDPARTSLLRKDCRPTESDGTRVLYSFPLNSCGNTVKIGTDSVTYQNEISPYSEFQNGDHQLDWVADVKSVVVECTYPLTGLLRFFWTYKFESESAGVGRILYATQQHSEELRTSTAQPATTRRKWSMFLRPSYRLPYDKDSSASFPRGVKKASK